MLSVTWLTAVLQGLEDVVRDRQFSVKTKEIYLKAEDEEDERNGELPCKKVREG